MTLNNSKDLSGEYQMNDNTLKNNNFTLEVGIRRRAKRGQSKRYLGFIDESLKPETEGYFTYISGLWSDENAKNSYSFDFNGKYYSLKVVGLNKVVIEEQKKAKALEYVEGSGNEWL